MQCNSYHGQYKRVEADIKFVWTREPANKNDKEENLGARTEGEKRMSQTGDSKMNHGV